MNPQNHGFKPSVITPEHFVHGDNKLGAGPVIQDGQWDSWLPIKEDQNIGIEPYACVSFATLNCVETLLLQEYGTSFNFSDRFLAYASGTQALHGNDPHSVMECLRKKGDVNQTDWPYTPDMNTWEKFYAQPPQSIYSLAIATFAEWAYGHSWVMTNQVASQDALMAALTFSPLSAAVFAWAQDENGLYYAPPGTQPCHYVMIYGFEKGQYFKVFDSYANEIKHLRWDFPFVQVKRHTIHKQIVDDSAWGRFIALIRSLLTP